MDGKHEVICIEANKVFDLCFQEHRVERFFTVDVEGSPAVVVDCQIDSQQITCREVNARHPVDAKKNKFLICLAIHVPVTLRVTNEVTGQVLTTLTRTLVVLKQVILCVPPGTTVQCDVTGNCCCVFDLEQHQVNCVFDLCIVVKSRATVQVLVPTFGICLPKECKGVPGGCPPVVPTHECDSDCS